ncbi:hypothetical protein P175DRAFT_0204072 [Aspergillus ochraceoroseus IBT 24754]|uniref:Elongator complex protein 6 n=2 Tax=Aspergillus ochraceoroseus TaxID=138278 RepID=A0A2T5M037_9EURO|nr:uncharacterized protein P175DRAFT_0204072 [Aspergillus ochraceoroseus IBT 24754]KKK13876.1 hypothetical protein AOCH_001531 [Aspergillus ochraceoroseus]PTU21888.1 hypothetical protein P175DRAFT_0204072 [Aspergillus ochraceoroseus IBT 24754]
MPSQPPLPHLLVPYISTPPQTSLTVLSSVLGATGNWLVLRFLYAALSTSPLSDTAGFGLQGETGRKRKVVLVSFLRGWEFWRTEAKRLGLDLARLSERRQFAFVDGLSELFCTPPVTVQPTSQSQFSGATIPPRTAFPLRPQPASPATARSRQPAPPPPGSGRAVPQTAAKETDGPKRLHFSGSGVAALDALEEDIATVIKLLKTPTPGEEEESEVLLVVDQPDLLLAATGPSKGIGGTEMGEWIMGLQQAPTATIVTISADSPLIHNASTFGHQTSTPLEAENAAFAVGLAHRAEMVMQLRNLETGAARDVSGVLRVSKGGAWGQRESETAQENWEEKEVLYFVQRDGGVSVFGRGE